MTRQIVITIEVPDGVAVQVGPPQVAASTANGAATSTPVCPKHGPAKVKESKYGGHYCTAADDSGPRGYCVWKSE